MIRSFATIIFLIFVINTWAGEFTGAGRRLVALLESNNQSMNELQRTGFELREGEFTGAGKNVPFGNIKLILTASEVIEKSDIDLVETQSGDVAPVPNGILSHNIKRFEANGKSYQLNQVKGMVIKK